MAKDHKNLIEAPCSCSNMESDENDESGRNGQKPVGSGHNGETGVDSQVMINPFYTHFHRKKDK